jgi:hypothetical protein
VRKVTGSEEEEEERRRDKNATNSRQYVLPPMPKGRHATRLTSNTFNVIQGRGPVRCVKKIWGRRGKPDTMELLVNIDMVRNFFV